MRRLDTSTPALTRQAVRALTIGGLFAAFGLAGCSGLGHYESDTLTLPGANPQAPSGSSETMLRVQDRPVASSPIVTDSGNVWPGPPRPFPTLGQVEQQTQNGQIGTQAPPGTKGAGAGPAFADPSATSGNEGFKMQANPNAASTIMIPNGNGTSTVIAPDGSVKVIPTPKDDAAK